LSDSSEEAKEPTQRKPRAGRDWSAKSLFIEVISIVLGVLLALGLSQWSEERQHRAQADVAIANILLEIGSNQTLLVTIHDNNAATVSAMNNPSPGEEQSQNFIPGLQLQETAWEAFLSTGLSNYANYDDVLALSQLYSIQDIYKGAGRQLVEASMQVSAFAVVQEKEIDDDQFQKQFLIYFEMLTAIEEQLLLSYDEVVAELSSDT
jgi:hypothetical protein